MLSGETLREMYHRGELGIEPAPEEEQFQHATLDLRMGGTLLNYGTGKVKEHTDEVVIHPWTFYLGHTLDYVTMPTDVVAELAGRSTVGRMGVVIHLTAGVIDPGWEGQVTLEVVNFSGQTQRLPVGMRVGQLLFDLVDRDTDGYSGRYQGQRGPTPRKGVD